MDLVHELYKSYLKFYYLSSIFLELRINKTRIRINVHGVKEKKER